LNTYLPQVLKRSGSDKVIINTQASKSNLGASLVTIRLCIPRIAAQVADTRDAGFDRVPELRVASCVEGWNGLTSFSAVETPAAMRELGSLNKCVAIRQVA
jgi:hypothetical protein